MMAAAVELDEQTSFVPVKYAARMLGVRRQRVYQLLAEGKIGGKRVEGTWFVSLVSVKSRMSMFVQESRRAAAERRERS